jgi:hypothetical protein
LALLDALDAGVLTVVAAGNDGPELDTIGSPSSAPWVLTTAASTQDGEFFDSGIEITAPSDLASAIVMREASFTPPLTSDDPIEELLIAADDGIATRTGTAAGSVRDACTALENSAEMEGHIALIERGGCEFQVKIANAEDGAIAAVVSTTRVAARHERRHGSVTFRPSDQQRRRARLDRPRMPRTTNRERGGAGHRSLARASPPRCPGGPTSSPTSRRAGRRSRTGAS